MRRCLPVAVGLLPLIAPLAQAPADPRPAATAERDGERCPTSRWYVDGGDAARNAASANPPILKKPLIAWRQPIDGPILGEPRVWDDFVVLAVQIGDKKRRVELRRLADGALIGKREQTSSIDPSPAMWGDEVVFRPTAGLLELWRCEERALRYVRRSRKQTDFGPPLRIGNEIYVRVDGQLACLRAGDLHELWRAPAGGPYVGQPTAVGGAIYAVQQVAGRDYAVVEHDRATGAPRDRSPAFTLTGAPGDDLTIQVAGNALIVRFADGHAFANYRAAVPLNGVQLRLPLGANRNPEPTAIPIRPALDASLCVQAVAATGDRQLGAFETGSDKGIRLDACDLHRAFADVPPTLLADVVYFGAAAVDRADYRLLWRVADPQHPLPNARAIPAGQSLLLAGERELVALRADVPADPVGTELSSLWHEVQRARLMPLVDNAIETADWGLCDQLLTRCRALGVDEDWAAKREKKISAGEKNKRVRVLADEAANVAATAAGVASAALDELQRTVAGWNGSRAAADQRRGLRFVLAHANDHAATVAAIRAMVPAGLPVAEPFQAGDWLDFLAVVAHTPVSFLEASLDDFAKGDLDPIAAQNKQQLLQWRKDWRKDLQAVQSARLLLFSPVTQPGSLAKALATGELVCELLESMFAAMPVKRQDPRPMLVFIYPDQAEYLNESKKLGVDSVEWTAGYYSYDERPAKSRLFVPRDDAGFARVLPTLAHELTHHWLMDRCPAIEPNAAGALYRPKGFWIVEGFASMVEQFTFDFERHSFRLGDGNLRRADIVASAEQNLLPWGKLVAMSGLDYDRFAQRQRPFPVASRTQLGRAYQATALGLFYAQSAMLARYLYEAEDGAHRQQLLDFVCAYYEGRGDALDFAKAFGVTADELGPKVLAFAQSLLP